jgi:hypothetical protein
MANSRLMENRAYLNKIGLGLAILIASHVPAMADSPRFTIRCSTEYAGTHREAFDQSYERIRLLAAQSQLEVSVALGLLQYQGGFRYPLQIQFEDSAPPGLENTLAFVRLYGDDATFAQAVVMNLEELQAANHLAWANVERIFYHEMTHAVLNDAVGGEATSRIPRWVQEGLAQYVSKEGEPRLQELGHALNKSQVRPPLFELEHPHPAVAYPTYYLAIRYLENKYTVNAVQAMVRHLIDGKPIEEAIHESTGLTLEEFQKNAQAYSVEVIRDLALPDGQVRRP